MRTLVNRQAFIVLAGIILLLLVSCVAEGERVTPSDSPVLPERGFLMGVLPATAEGQTFEDIYRRAAAYADFVPVWGRPTPFYDMAKELSGNWGQVFIQQYVRGNGMFPLIHLSFMGPDMTLASPPGISEPALNNPEWRQSYKQAALDTVRASRPLYLSLGNEVNRWYEKYGAADGDANGFQHYVSLYEEIYGEVKELSPKTQVFCTFAREVVSENREADMNILQMFNPDKLDILVLTSYPHAVQGINRPSDIPDDYYSRLKKYMPGKPVGFSEAAWPSLEAFGGEQGQARFLGDLCGRLTQEGDLELRLLGWPWLHDLDDNDYIGLIRRDRTPKLAYTVWKSISITGQWRTREQAIPSTAVKITPETDVHPPILHSTEYEQPVPMPYPMNTAGAEDSGFIMPDGDTFYLWFTPDPNIPVQEQLFDGVTGLYVSHKVDRVWQEPQRIWLQYPGELALDGCLFVQEDRMWFASARTGYSGMPWFTASFVNGEWTDWKEAGFNPEYEVGELHISADGRELYFHSARPGGKGKYDIWVSKKENGEWLPPQNVEAVNSPETDGWPFLTEDGNELWFTRTYLGSPAIFRAEKVNGEWQEPELIISQFAAEPSLDFEGNIYFTHHFFNNGLMLEADYYVAKRKG
ncbi:MAG: PD40 domain-containing protein [Dehalococcoidia bacterium]|nr:PD40 domain-containing protein [Dehalococcoidia bacterium]